MTSDSVALLALGILLVAFLRSRRLEPGTVKRLLAGVLVIAGLKLLFAP